MNLQENIIEQIKSNKLVNLPYDLMLSQLCVLNNKPCADVKNALDALIDKRQVVLLQNDSVTAEQCTTNCKNFSKFDKRKRNKKMALKSTISSKTMPPKSPYGIDDKTELAYDMLQKKDKKRETKNQKVEGKLQCTSKGYAFLIPTDITIEDIFVAQSNLNGAMHTDRVVVATQSHGGKRLEGRVLQVLERGSERVVGVFRRDKKLAFVTPDDVKFGKDVNIALDKVGNANNGDKVVVKIVRYYASKRNPDGEIVEVLGKPNMIDTEIMAILRSYNLYENFPKKVIDASKSIAEDIDKSAYPSRLDFTNNITFTIDGEDTRDIDDALSIEINPKGNRVLGVHIADVGEYVKRDNVFDKEAFKRGTSVYFPNLVLPMLPRELSNGICSLNERVDRLALSCFMEFDNDANLVDYKICESVINSKKRFTYTLVQKIFDGFTDENQVLIDKLLLMRTLAKQLEQKRIDRGAIEFNIPEVKVELNELGEVIDLKKREHNESHKLIESFMIVANETIATHFMSKNTPFVYRIHEKPNSEKVNKLLTMINSFGISHKINSENIEPKEIQTLLNSIKGEPSEYVLNKIALRTMKKAKYSPECMGHFGLASIKYCHFTSPIRRYPDLTIHRIIKSELNHRLNDTSRVELKNFVNIASIQSSETERNAEAVERDVDDLYRVFYMLKRVGEEFDGVISSVTNFGVFVELDSTVEGMIKVEDLPADQYEFFEDRLTLKGYNHKYSIGDKIRVKAVRADIISREIDFVIV